MVWGSGRAAPRSGAGAVVRRTASACLATGSGRGPDDLAQRGADQAGGIARVVMTVEHGHDQAECLCGAEHQRRQPQAPADTVAAVGAPHRLDRDASLAQDRDVPAGGAVGDAELAGEPVGSDAGVVLQQLEAQQCPRRGVPVVHPRRVAQFRKRYVRSGDDGVRGS